MSDDDRKLFVGRLPPDIHEDEMRTVFNTYGRVLDVHIMEGGRSRPGQEEIQRCGFVTYDTVESARAACQVLNNVYKFREEQLEPIHVSFARPRGSGKSGGKGGFGDRPPFDDRGGAPRSFDSYDRGGKGGYDRDYDRGFDRGYDRPYDRGCGGGKGGYDRPLGPDRGQYDHPSGSGYSGGYGSPRDRGYDDRDRGFESRDRGLDRGYDRPAPAGGYDRGYDRPAPGSDRGFDRGFDRGYDRAPPREDFRDGGKGGGRKGGHAPGAKLYVGNLPADITRDALEMVFGTYGRVEDVHIMTGRSKSGQSCAFVAYSSPSEAKVAISAMQSGYEIRPGEGNILVKYADDKPRSAGGFGAGGGGGGCGGDRFRPY